MTTAKEAKQNKGTDVTSISLRITNNLKGGVDEFIARGATGIQTIYYYHMYKDQRGLCKLAAELKEKAL